MVCVSMSTCVCMCECVRMWAMCVREMLFCVKSFIMQSFFSSHGFCIAFL